MPIKKSQYTRLCVLFVPARQLIFTCFQSVGLLRWNWSAVVNNLMCFQIFLNIFRCQISDTQVEGLAQQTLDLHQRRKGKQVRMWRLP